MVLKKERTADTGESVSCFRGPGLGGMLLPPFGPTILVIAVAAAAGSCDKGSGCEPMDPSCGVTAPAAPSQLSATVVSGSQIDLTWRDNSDNETEFRVERTTVGTQDWSEIGRSQDGAYSDRTLSPNGTYSYRVHACNAAGCSGYTNEASATTWGPPDATTAPATSVASSSAMLNGTVRPNGVATMAWFEWGASPTLQSFSKTPEQSSGAGRDNRSFSAELTNLDPASTYYYRAAASNAVGSVSGDILNFTTADVPPLAPSNLAAAAVSASQIDLTWQDNSENETEFRVERKTGAGGSWSELTTLGANTTGHSDTGLDPATAYFYRVRACNPVGCSDYSNEGSATTPDVPPLAPSDLVATAVSATQIDLTWQDNSENETEFRVERKTGAGGSWSELTTLGANTTGHSDTGLDPVTEYSYRVRACNTVGCSDYSNEASATTPDVPPAAPSNLVATAVSASQIDLSWQDNSDNELLFGISRKVEPGGAWYEFAAAFGTTFSDTGRDPATVYSYRVRACNGIGCSDYSNEGSAKTPLQDGVPVTDLSGAQGSENSFRIVVPTASAAFHTAATRDFNHVRASGIGAAKGVEHDQGALTAVDGMGQAATGGRILRIGINGGSGDADLYVRYGTPPDLSTYDCRPFFYGNNEVCEFGEPAAGDWYIMIHGFTGYSGMTLLGELIMIGDLQVRTQTTGTGLDSDGYTVIVDGTQSQAIAINAGVNFPQLEEGDHTVELAGVAANCTVSGENPRVVSVPPASTAQTVFDVHCTTLALASVTAGGFHDCGIAESGRTYCWGNNVNGELGDGTTTSSSSAVLVSGGETFRQVDAGGGFVEDHTCAVTYTGIAYCWGANGVGQLGDGSKDFRTSPTAVSGNWGFHSVSLGAQHSCGLAASTPGPIYCWGLNNTGQLGDVTVTDTTKPVLAQPGVEFLMVSAGGFHTCAIASTLNVVCWGSNVLGQLGDGTSPGYFFEVSAGGFHTCGVVVGYDAYCWGFNNSGQLGDGTTAEKSTAPVLVRGGLELRSVSAGADHTCGVTTDDLAYCWGDNTYGQLGNGTTTDSTEPVPVAGGLRFKSVSAGNSHTCAVTIGGIAYCWGSGETRPVPVPGSL